MQELITPKKKPGPKVNHITPPTPEEVLNILAEALFERISEESKSGKLAFKLKTEVSSV